MAMEHETSASDRGSSAVAARSRKSLKIQNDELDEAVGETIEVFLNRGWDIFEASPLFGFKNTELSLKKYSLVLRQHCVLMDVNEDVEYMVKFTCIDNCGYEGKDEMIKREITI